MLFSGSIREEAMVMLREPLFSGELKNGDGKIYWNIWGEITNHTGRKSKCVITRGTKTSCYTHVCQIKGLVSIPTIYDTRDDGWAPYKPWGKGG